MKIVGAATRPQSRASAPGANITALLFLVLVCQSLHVVNCRHRRSGDVTSSNSVDGDICTRLVQQIYHGHVTAPNPPDVTGDWTSQRCEVRPGPEYILRRYRFLNSSRFETQQYYYQDADCTVPEYSIMAQGNYYIQGDSWTVPGGTEVDYQLSYVTIVPYTEEKAIYLTNLINKSCPGHSSSQWKPYQRYDVYRYIDFEDATIQEQLEEGYEIIDKDCTDALDFSLHELQLMRVEQRHHHHGNRRMLYVGDVHTEKHERQMYRPTSYQEPLLDPKTHGCKVCEQVANSVEFNPPTLRQRHPVSIDLPGEWFSERCETRPNSLFLTRRLLFSNKNQWEGYYYHYADALCREPMFTLYTKGSYVGGTVTSAEVSYAYHYDFKVTQVKVTPEDERMSRTYTAQQKGLDCAGPVEWEVGVERDISKTKGCNPLSINVPHVEYELLKVEKEHQRHKLYLGQRATDGEGPVTTRRRPTSFQPPLIKCSRNMHVDFRPPVKAKVHVYHKGAATQLLVNHIYLTLTMGISLYLHLL